MLVSAKKDDAKAPPAEKELPPLTLDCVHLQEHKNWQWRAYLPAGFSAQDAVKPRVWDVMRAQVTPYDTCLALAADHSFIAEILFTDSSQANGVDAILLREIKLPPKRATVGSRIPKGFSIRFDPKTSRWLVIRDSDGFAMNSDSPTEEAAIRYLLDSAAVTQGVAA